MNSTKFPVFAIAATFIAMLTAQLYVMLSLREGLFFNSYPFITNDGFDWIFQGQALLDLIRGESNEHWPYLRSPGLVLVSFFDSLLFDSGALLLFVQVLGVALGLLSLYWVSTVARLPLFVSLCYLLAFYFTPLGHFRLFVLSDSLASGLLALSVASFLHFKCAGRREVWLYVSAATALVAGLFQTYGLIPFLVLASLEVAAGILFHKKLPLRMLSLLIVVGLLFCALLFAWTELIPHRSRPNQFTLLALNLNMTEFYFHTWIFTFGPLLPLFVGLLVCLIWTRDVRTLRESASFYLLCLLGTFGVVAFFYQWADARFTFIYVPVFLLFLIVTHAELLRVLPTASMRRTLLHSGAVLSCLLYVFVGTSVGVGSFWSPRLDATFFAPEKAWVGSLVNARAIDLLSLRERCGAIETICEEAVIPNKGSAYRQRMLALLKEREL